jgi:hypothetical protein
MRLACGKAGLKRHAPNELRVLERRSRSRASVVECGSPLLLSHRPPLVLEHPGRHGKPSPKRQRAGALQNLAAPRQVREKGERLEEPKEGAPREGTRPTRPGLSSRRLGLPTSREVPAFQASGRFTEPGTWACARGLRSSPSFNRAGPRPCEPNDWVRGSLLLTSSRRSGINGFAPRVKRGEEKNGLNARPHLAPLSPRRGRISRRSLAVRAPRDLCPLRHGVGELTRRSPAASCAGQNGLQLGRQIRKVTCDHCNIEKKMRASGDAGLPNPGSWGRTLARPRRGLWSRH